MQAWDFTPGSNFILEMQKAASECERTVAVLSPDYLESTFTQPEWAAAFAGDPMGKSRKLVPVVSLSGLTIFLTQKLLNLLDLATRVSAEAGAGPPQVIRSDIGQTTSFVTLVGW